MAEYVINRNGEHEPMQLDRIGDRIQVLSMTCGARLHHISKLAIMKLVTPRISSGMTTLEIDHIVAEVCASMSASHPDYSLLSARISISNMHRQGVSFLEATRRSHETGRIDDTFCQFVAEHADAIESRIDYSRDYNFDALGASSFISSYLKKGKDGKPTEVPQHAYMRLAIMLNCFDLVETQPTGHGMRFVGEHDGDLSQRWVELKPTYDLRVRPDVEQNLENAFVSYESVSTQKISHATPTMVNIGTKNHQLASCFLISASDSLEFILKAETDAGMASKGGGGVGVDFSPLRSNGQLIRKTGGKSSGAINFVPPLEKKQVAINQGGTRPGAFVVWLCAHSGDLLSLLEIPRSHSELAALGNEAQDIKIGVMVPDLFWRKLAERIETQKPVEWYLFSPDTAPGLNEAFDQPGGRQQYTDLYNHYVEKGLFVKVLDVAEVFKEILHTQSMTGVPYIINKDQINTKNNLVDTPDMFTQTAVPEVPKLGRNGVIRISNLCTEIAIPTDNYHRGVCVLGAINLTKFVTKNLTMKNKVAFDFDGLQQATRQMTRHLDQVISVSTYPSPGARASTMAHRPIGIGVGGMYDAFCMMQIEYGSPEAIELDQAIHATIYYAAVQASSVLAEELGRHPSYPSTRMAAGDLQPDLWVKAGHLTTNWADDIDATMQTYATPNSRALNWPYLRDRVKIYGVRNGLLTAGMPTASTSALMGCSEAATPRASQIMVRKLLFGMATLINPHLLTELGDIWSEDLRKRIIANGGSIQGISEIPADIRRRYKTAREIEPHKYIFHVAARGAFISQSISNNWYLRSIDGATSASLYILAYRLGLTTASYYVYTEPKGTAHNLNAAEAPACSLANRDCVACSV